jgi:hypothetical protein
VDIKVFLELIYPEAESFSEPQFPPKGSSLKQALLEWLKNLEVSKFCISQSNGVGKRF